MKWEDTVASTCRYGNMAGNYLFDQSEIIWEQSEADWQGSAKVLSYNKEGTLTYFEWCYGSCSMCDDWESRDLNEEQIGKEMKRDAINFPNIEEALRYFQLSGLTESTVLSKLRGASDTFNSCREALLKWNDCRGT
jgi:hypothetical protein